MKTTNSMMMPAVLTIGLLMGSAVFAENKAPDFELSDVNGKTHTLDQYSGKIVVLEWTNYGCPFVKKFYSVGAMQDIQEKYTREGVVWLSICSSAPGKQGNFSRSEWLERTDSHGVKATAVLLDETGKTGRDYGAKNTPHMFVIDRSGKLAYQGAIDDTRSTDSDDIAKARNYVTEALDSLLAGKPVSVAKTKPYGCSVKY